MLFWALRTMWSISTPLVRVVDLLISISSPFGVPVMDSTFLGPDRPRKLGWLAALGMWMVTATSPEPP